MACISGRTDGVPRKTQTSITAFRRDHPYVRRRGVGARRGSNVLFGNEIAERFVLGRRNESGKSGLSETIRLDLSLSSELAFRRAPQRSRSISEMERSQFEEPQTSNTWKAYG